MIVFAVLSWNVILEALLESEFIQRNGDTDDGPMSAHLVREITPKPEVLHSPIEVPVRLAI